MASTLSTTTHTQASIDVRRLGLACAVSGVLMLVAGGIPASPEAVPDDQWGYPQTPARFLVISLVLAVAHVLSAGGFLGAKHLGAAGEGRAARAGFNAAIVGLIALGLSEVFSGLIADKPLNSGTAALVGTLFGVSSLLFAAGAITAGIAIIRSRTWPGWERWLALATGVIIVVLVTPANAIGDPIFRWVSLAIWAALFIPLGLQVARGLNPRATDQ